MPIFLDTRGNTTLGIGICDRCKMKFPLGELYPDRNVPGLRVCDADNDEYDPWRLPARESDQLTLQFVRPDAPLAPGSTPDSGKWVISGQPFRPSSDTVEPSGPADPAPNTIIPWEDPNG